MMKKAVMQFTACCLALGISISSFGAVAFADNSMTLAGLSETSTVAAATSVTLAGLTETGTAATSGGDGSTAAVTEETAEAAADETSSTDSEAADTESEETSSATETDATGTLAGAAATTEAETTAAAEASAEAQTETETELVYDTSMSGELAFAQCDNYINVRSDASTDGEVVGKIYNNNSVTILGQLGDWYEIQSGNVTGYVKADYFATGEAADEIAETVAYNVATVNAEGLWVHTEASEDSETIAMVYSSDQMEVVSYEGDWMKVVLEDGTYGYVNAWYVDYDTYYSTGETLEEESERLDEEWLEYLAESEAEQERLDEQWLAYLAEQEAAAEASAAETEASTAAETYVETTTSTDTSSSSSTTLSEAEAAVDEAYQAYVEAQEAADAATQQADEQLVYDTYDEAVDAYQDYLDAVAVADELKYSSDTAGTTTTTTTETTTTTTETTQTEAAQTEAVQTEAAQTEAAQTEAAQTEAAQTEAVQTEAAQTEATTTSTSSSSTLGQSIANYAVQFVGNPYVYGGTSLTNGADCSGFTQSVFANFGISIPRTAASQASSGTSVSLSDIQAGDLLFYSDGSGISHVALYIGGGQVVHASTSSTGIIISSYNYRTPVCARRYWS
ncbi:MAG: C40 family peptidase [Lachnospiraceae bacterium]|nr:C40 family peptidase [Lachnospiraceae bacterium]